jgi:tRNA 2-thiocytidine biosynthesis protein TtcA
MNDRLRKSQKQFEKISKKVGKMLIEHQLVEAGDRVLVGLSGGKDSMILLEALADRRRRLPFDFKLFAVHVSASNIGYEMDTGYLEEFCAELDIPLYLEEIEVDLTIDPKKAPCFICSWNRRKRIFELSKELDCNKVALGHHKDDAIQTLLMNMIYHGSISSLPQKLSMFNGRIRLIRPLLFIPEKELTYYATLRSFSQQEKSCPFDNKTKRESIKELIRQLDRLNRNARRNIFQSMDNIYEEYLPQLTKKERTIPEETDLDENSH